MARLCAFMMSLMSPVSPSENSVMGISRSCRRPAAVPFTFIVGPPEGWRSAPPTFTPPLAKAFHQTARCCAFTFAQRCRGDSCNLNVLAVRLIFETIDDLEKSILEGVPWAASRLFAAPTFRATVRVKAYFFQLLRKSASRLTSLHHTAFLKSSLYKRLFKLFKRLELFKLLTQ